MLVWGPALGSPTTRRGSDRIFQVILGIVNLEGIERYLCLLATTVGGGSFAEEPPTAWCSHIMAVLSHDDTVYKILPPPPCAHKHKSSQPLYTAKV